MHQVLLSTRKSNFAYWFLQGWRRSPNTSSQTVRGWEALRDRVDHCRHPWESTSTLAIQSSFERLTLEQAGSQIRGVHLQIYKRLLAKWWCSPPLPLQWLTPHHGHLQSRGHLRLCDGQELVGHQWPRLGFSKGPQLHGILHHHRLCFRTLQWWHFFFILTCYGWLQSIRFWIHVLICGGNVTSNFSF